MYTNKMTSEVSTINVKIFKNDEILKKIEEPTVLNSRTWTTHLESLKRIQKSVNMFLTALVQEEKSADSFNFEEQEQEEDSSESSEVELENLAFKRKCKLKSEMKNKKIKIDA